MFMAVCSAARISTKPFEKWSKWNVFLICLFNEAELYWVSTNILKSPEFKQFEIGISINLYLPPIGTAGFDLSLVSGYNLVPAPPPKIRQIERPMTLDKSEVWSVDIGWLITLLIMDNINNLFRISFYPQQILHENNVANIKALLQRSKGCTPWHPHYPIFL